MFPQGRSNWCAGFGSKGQTSLCVLSVKH